VAALRIVFAAANSNRGTRAARLHSALFGIFAFIDVPLVFGAIRWWRTQHPSAGHHGRPGVWLGSHHAEGSALLPGLAMCVLMAFLIAERYVAGKNEIGSRYLQREAEAQ